MFVDLRGALSTLILYTLLFSQQSAAIESQAVYIVPDLSKQPSYLVVNISYLAPLHHHQQTF